MDDGDFPVSENALNRTQGDKRPDPCMFCKFGMICGKSELDGGAEDE